MKVSWTAETGASSYTIYDSTTSITGPWTSLASGQTGTSYTTAALSGTSGGTNYWFAVATKLTDTNWTLSTQSTGAGPRLIKNTPACS